MNVIALLPKNEAKKKSRIKNLCPLIKIFEKLNFLLLLLNFLPKFTS